jgi:hypothetical protein
MFQIVYTSKARIAFLPHDLEHLLRVARERNAARGVTGMLVFCEQQFLQVLEGEAREVVATFNKIELDPRHRNLDVLHRGYSKAGKRFREWSMGFHHVASAQDVPAGFVHINNRINLAQFDGDTALEFLLACQPQPALPESAFQLSP